MTSVGKLKLASDQQECPYGAGCYRKNPQHFIDFSHSKKAKLDVDDDRATYAAKHNTAIIDASLPVCKYGAKCYRKNLLHFAEYSHPTTVVDNVISDNASDTDEISDEDAVPDKPKGTGEILQRGMSLVKSYSQMTEDERKELIKKAFEAKKMLQEELEKTKEEVKKKDQQLETLQAQVSTGLLLMDGEKEALEGAEVKYFELVAERQYKEGSAAQTHFRLAESQFYRLLSGNYSQFRLTTVEYVVNPELAKQFKKCREILKAKRGDECSYPVLAFHGTLETNILPICEQGFKVPGSDGHSHRTDTGFYGKGVYFSEYPGYCMGYIKGASKLLLCQVLPGKVYNCTKLIHGAALKAGFDSHTSPDKKELVIFNKYHILPSYVVHYENVKIGMEFTYTDGKTKKMKTSKKHDTEDIGIAHLFDDAELSEKYMKASDKKRGTKCFPYKVQFTGTFKGTQKEMMELAEAHGATQGTKAVFDLLVASHEEFDVVSKKVSQALKKNVPIVAEMFLYDSIIKGKKLNTKNYEFKE